MRKNIVKTSFDRILIAVVVLCLAVGAAFSHPADARATSKYTKSFTKTITVKPLQKCEITMDVKNAATVKGTVKATTKAGEAIVGLEGVFGTIYSARPSVTVTKKVTRGKHVLQVGNAGSKTIKFKVKVSAGSAVLKCTSVKYADFDEVG